MEVGTKQREELEREKLDVQGKLDLLDSEVRRLAGYWLKPACLNLSCTWLQKVKFDGELAELRRKCAEEEEEVGGPQCDISLLAVIASFSLTPSLPPCSLSPTFPPPLLPLPSSLPPPSLHPKLLLFCLSD